MPKRQIVVIAHNIRSCHNVGALFRTAEGIGLERMYLTGYTPYPEIKSNDVRLPHERQKIQRRINKTGLGCELLVPWSQQSDVVSLLKMLVNDGYQLVALENSKDALRLQEFKASNKIALLLGSEIGGIKKNLLSYCDQVVKIPMEGSRSSYNVVVATAMVLYRLRFI